MHEQVKLHVLFESKTWIYHEPVASRRMAEWQGGVGQNCLLIDLRA